MTRNNIHYLVQLGDTTIGLSQESNPELIIGKYIEVKRGRFIHHIYLELANDGIDGKIKHCLIKELQFKEERDKITTTLGIWNIHRKIVSLAYSAVKTLKGKVSNSEVRVNGMNHRKLEKLYTALILDKEDSVGIMNRFMRKGIESKMHIA